MTIEVVRTGLDKERLWALWDDNNDGKSKLRLKTGLEGSESGRFIIIRVILDVDYR